MKESNNKGVANHVVPESWGASRKGVVQALTGVRVGWAIEPRKLFPAGCAAGIWGADLFPNKGRPHRRYRSRKVSKGSTRSKTSARTDAPRTGTGRSHRPSAREADRIGKPEGSSR